MASSSNAFIKWVAGILATVISSVLIYYLTIPKPPRLPESSIQIEGRVIDLATKSLIEGAHVTLRAGKYSGSQSTDSVGRYGFDVPLPETTEATFEIVAVGYPRYSVNGTLKKLSEVDDNQLLHEAVGGASPTTGSAAPASPSPTPPQGTSATGGLAGGGKGALIGAAIGAVVNHGMALPPASSGSPVQGPTNTKTTVVLPPYVRRPDLVRIGPRH